MPDESRVKPQPLQPEELKAIEARCEAAAPGPWKREGDAVYTGHECGDTCERTLNDHFVFADPDVKPADAEFIAHARTDIPRLIATIEEDRREQPEPQGVLCTDCNRIIIASAEIKIRGGRAVHFNCPGEVVHGELEQPVRVTDADVRACLDEFNDFAEMNTPETNMRAALEAFAHRKAAPQCESPELTGEEALAALRGLGLEGARLRKVIALSENVLSGQVWPHGGNSFAQAIADAARGIPTAPKEGTDG